MLDRLRAKPGRLAGIKATVPVAVVFAEVVGPHPIVGWFAGVPAPASVEYRLTGIL